MTDKEFDDIEIGDYVKVEYTGTGHMSGGSIEGNVVEIWNNEPRQRRVQSGWCFHPKDKLLLHTKVLSLKE